jgi:hypothetical protein
MVTAEAVQDAVLACDPGHADRLANAVTRAREALLDPEQDTDELERVRASLTQTTVIIIGLAQGDAVAAIERGVIVAAKHSIERLRAWYLPAGFESCPTQIPPIEKLV